VIATVTQQRWKERGRGEREGWERGRDGREGGRDYVSGRIQLILFFVLCVI